MLRVHAPERYFTFVVEPGSLRLDAHVVLLLQSHSIHVSRATVQRWISDGLVTVDGACRKASFQPTIRCTVGVRVPRGSLDPVAENPSVNVDVLYQDDHLVVVNKPAGLVVHPARGHCHDTLLNGLVSLGLLDPSIVDDYDDDLVGASPDIARRAALRPGVVHRLDKDTSGLLVVARTAEAYGNLKDQFGARSIERLYEAVVVGTAADAIYDTPYGRHPHNRIKFTSLVEAERRAITEVRVLATFARGGASHVECRLRTGRTHQIRVHLSEQAGTPVLGDVLYGSTSLRGTDETTAASVRGVGRELVRHWLHAKTLGFRHPVSGKPMHFEQPPPAELQAALHTLASL